mmetsp:Transcript_7113/g.20170  ORF Transcript_7113/g.20170 Transcript_7113/m.20170 type:complete len:118 (-) Transcript_7113:60-413(-)
MRPSRMSERSMQPSNSPVANLRVESSSTHNIRVPAHATEAQMAATTAHQKGIGLNRQQRALSSPSVIMGSVSANCSVAPPLIGLTPSPGMEEFMLCKEPRWWSIFCLFKLRRECPGA